MENISYLIRDSFFLYIMFCTFILLFVYAFEDSINIMLIYKNKSINEIIWDNIQVHKLNELDSITFRKIKILETEKFKREFLKLIREIEMEILKILIFLMDSLIVGNVLNEIIKSSQ
ncbi:hypothetical protein [Streptobacillus moniliformis]|uniref:hypothetical protein n=1 Tax=Streptobacillus moniliformis TaxID=34105 RepID=UPI0007E490A3|nr:hypothetical protein [Streptobacillus moniliformis]